MWRWQVCVELMRAVVVLVEMAGFDFVVRCGILSLSRESFFFLAISRRVWKFVCVAWGFQRICEQVKTVCCVIMCRSIVTRHGSGSGRFFEDHETTTSVGGAYRYFTSRCEITRFVGANILRLREERLFEDEDEQRTTTTLFGLSVVCSRTSTKFE